MRQMSPQWQTREVADVLLWLRRFNEGRADKVQFFGVEYYLTGQLAYDALDGYVARTAPERLDEVRRHLQAIRPPTPNIFEYIEQLAQVADKAPYLDHARQVQALVESIPHPAEDDDHAIATHHARQIVSFYEHNSMSFADGLVYRDQHAAENVAWWRDLTGDRIAYWAASAHTANAADLRIAVPPQPDLRYASAGSYLRQRFGERYLSIGFTFDHGTVALGPGQTAPMPPPPTEWFEQPLGDVPDDQFALDLRRRAPQPVQRWRDGPLVTRGLADAGPASYISGASLAEWFDVIVHRQTVTAAGGV
jgi:erythromycin esterase